MFFTHALVASLLWSTASVYATPSVGKRTTGFEYGQPISGDGKGGPILGKSQCHGISYSTSRLSDSRHRRHKQGAGPPEPRQPWPPVHGQRRRAQPEMELLRFQDAHPQRRLGARTGHHRPSSESRHCRCTAAPEEGRYTRAALASSGMNRPILPRLDDFVLTRRRLNGDSSIVARFSSQRLMRTERIRCRSSATATSGTFPRVSAILFKVSRRKMSIFSSSMIQTLTRLGKQYCPSHYPPALQAIG